MFSKIIILVLTTSAALAIPTNQPGACNTGSVQCCKQMAEAGSHDASNMLSSVMGSPVQGVTGLVGANCSPITLIGAGQGANCVNSPVCCTQNNIRGSLVSTGCNPVNVAP